MSQCGVCGGECGGRSFAHFLDACSRCAPLVLLHRDGRDRSGVYSFLLEIDSSKPAIEAIQNMLTDEIDHQQP